MEKGEENRKHRWLMGTYIFMERVEVCLMDIQDGRRHSNSFNNGAAGFHQLKDWSKTHGNELSKDTLCCVGHTGLNTRELVHYLLSQEVDVWLESLENIKRRMKHLLDKSDKMDVGRITYYALLRQEHAVLINLTRVSVGKLKDLQGNRTRLVNAIQLLQAASHELEGVDAESVKMLEIVNREALHGLETSLRRVEEMINQYINSSKLKVARNA